VTGYGNEVKIGFDGEGNDGKSGSEEEATKGGERKERKTDLCLRTAALLICSSNSVINFRARVLLVFMTKLVRTLHSSRMDGSSWSIARSLFRSLVNEVMLERDFRETGGA
jgi:hypothetical protein